MIRVNSQIILNESELEFEFVLASGPGGQNVNKVSTAVQLRFNLAGSPSIPEEIKQRVGALARNQISKEGILILQSQEYRSQDRNRQKVMEKLIDLILRASVKPKKRRHTKPTKASVERRIETKKKQGQVKKQRRSIKKEIEE